MKKYSGVLFIGDPHITAIKPKRRIEEDYFSVSMGKLVKSLSVANENNLYPVILGDIVERPVEKGIVVSMIKALKGLKVPLNIGNHDVSTRRYFNHRRDSMVTDGLSDISIDIPDDTTVGVLNACDCIEVINSIQERHVYLDDDTMIRLLFVPYGIPIPERYPEYQGDFIGNVRNVMITHHDINFGVGIQYPGSLKMFPIENCELVVNGHIHDYKPPQEVGDTIWFNPGNIIRNSKSNSGNIPAVYSIGGDLSIERHVLDHKLLDDVYINDFDFNQYSTDGEVGETLENFSSKFVSNFNLLEDDKTEDGSAISEVLIDHFSESPASNSAIPEVLFDLLDRVKEAEKG